MATPDIGPASAGVAHINEYGQQHFGRILDCSWTENKGRIVHATRDFKQGEIIFAESPLHVVQEDASSEAFRRVQELCKQHQNDFDYEPLWYWCALRSLTPEQIKGAKAGGLKGADPGVQKNLLLLHHEVPEKPSSSANILAREITPKADVMLIERLIQVWVLNCFEYSDRPQGYSTYFFSSFMSHSCFPNAIWHYQGDDHVLRARRDIKVGDEVCISYLTEDGLLQCAAMRRWDLHETKQFWCACERCAGELDTSRGFVCPKCGEGAVFSRAPGAGAAKSPVSLAADLVGQACSDCPHKITKKEAEKMTAHESTLKTSIEKYSEKKKLDEALALKEFSETENFIDLIFRQHALADLMWEKLVDYYAHRRRFSDQRRLLERRCAFHEAAYPGLSAAHAWCLEAFADALRSGDAAQEPVSSTSSTTASSGATTPTSASRKASKKAAGKKAAQKWQKAVKAEPEDSRRKFSQALVILQLMFGQGHDYVTGLEAKLKTLSESAAMG